MNPASAFKDWTMSSDYIKKMYEGHAIVVDITGKMLYDPHPDETGLTAIIEYHRVGKI